MKIPVVLISFCCKNFIDQVFGNDYETGNMMNYFSKT